ncbi:DNA-binding transcriptional regulator, MocR family, contains an aminotransferase domain [Jannaschia faecimaris]|uniref:DNA-binding transcriptional regulator, MocR family, contains an aminotransferase domain n=1 Tax=Jannaschia faecimaris TaxID=1244108 RepID=A0A1H3SLF3_9RHOB|nr:PLP-dependent aminotransferase family protein [Jannaschia faecimaris]SDZ38415.1 DNA-binding transcriptional regulator, MocR family, contains an aminotransferase domain [Jannaschia faecimaris]
MSTITDQNVIHVDFGADERPKYVVLEGAIRAAITRGDLTPGTRLPAVRDLAWRVGVTPGTVARAYSRLTDDGTLDAAVGRGTFVAEAGVRSPIYRELEALEVDSTPHLTGGDSYMVNLLSPHLPSVGQVDLIRRLLGEIAANPPSGLMHYPAHANERLAREAAQHFLDHPALGPLEVDDITLTNGGQHAISLVMQAVLTGRRPAVLVEDLTYPGFRRVAEMLRADVIPVATDAEGIIPEALEAATRNADAQLLCTSPDVHNPTCTMTPESRRRQIVEVARASNIQILEDDCYQMERSELPTYRLMAPERTWHISSIAKTISPALRLGFAMAPRTHRISLRRAAEYSSFGMATPMSDLAARLLVDPALPGLMADTRKVVGTYVRTAAQVLDGFELHCRPDVSFMWLVLPRGWRASSFCRAAEGVGVKLRAAEEYAGRDANAPHAVRMSVNAGVSLASFEDAIRRLRDLLDQPPEGLGV